MRKLLYIYSHISIRYAKSVCYAFKTKLLKQFRVKHRLVHPSSWLMPTAFAYNMTGDQPITAYKPKT